jgi:hypothetical protein
MTEQPCLLVPAGANHTQARGTKGCAEHGGALAQQTRDASQAKLGRECLSTRTAVWLSSIAKK